MSNEEDQIDRAGEMTDGQQSELEHQLDRFVEEIQASEPVAAQGVKSVPVSQEAVAPEVAEQIPSEPVTQSEDVETAPVSEAPNTDEGEQIQSSELAAALEGAESTPAPEDPVYKDMAEQIESLLDDARRQQEDPLESSGKPGGPRSEAASSTLSAPISGVSDAADVRQLDHTLADQADIAIAGQFETVDDLLSTEELASLSKSGSVHATDPDRNAEIAGLALGPGNESKLSDQLSDGSFETIEDVLAAAEVAATDQSAPVGFNAAAADVARELDEQPESQPPPQKASPTRVKVSPLPAWPGWAGLKSALLVLAGCRNPARIFAAIKQARQHLHQICIVLNKPLLYFSPETRNLVGYIGLLTIFNASVIILFKLIAG